MGVETTGITDIDWLDAKVCEQSKIIENLKADYLYIVESLEEQIERLKERIREREDDLSALEAEMEKESLRSFDDGYRAGRMEGRRGWED